MEDIKRILVVSRMTHFDRKALHYGVSLAKQYGAELYLVYVMHDPFGVEGWNLPFPSLDEDYKRELKKARESLDKMVEEERAKGLGVKVMVKEGEPAKEVINLVAEEKIDLIIMLASEEGKIEHFFFGRSNDEIIRKVPCSIMLVKKEVKWY